jgi:hypothetical protein
MHCNGHTLHSLYWRPVVLTTTNPVSAWSPEFMEKHIDLIYLHSPCIHFSIQLIGLLRVIGYSHVKVDNMADAHRHHLKNSRVVNVNVNDGLQSFCVPTSPRRPVRNRREIELKDALHSRPLL